MEASSSALIEAIVGRLIPPAAREHVLGDLRERSRSTLQLVSDALRTVPWVILSQMRRASDHLLVLMQAYTLFLVLRPQRFTSAAADQIWRLAIPIAAALLVLAFRDAYRPMAVRVAESPASREIGSAFDQALSRALVDAALATLAVWAARPGLGTSVFGVFIMLTPVRIGWEVVFRAHGYRRLALHPFKPGEITREVWRRAAQHRSDLLRSSWLWYPAPLLLTGYAMVLLKPSRNLWTVIVEASVTTFALLLLRAIARRAADLLDRDINSE
jgi:hypothetical protein